MDTLNENKYLELMKISLDTLKLVIAIKMGNIKKSRKVCKTFWLIYKHVLKTYINKNIMHDHHKE